MLRPFFAALIALLLGLPALAQDYTGTWQGQIVLQKPRIVTYSLRVELQQTGHQVTGTTYMVQRGSDQEHVWDFRGLADGDEVIFSEIENVSGVPGCWKSYKMRLQPQGNVWKLRGDFSATNCQSVGTVTLRMAAKPIPEPTVYDDFLYGRWTGFLAQEDKSYDYHYEINLFPGGVGRSSISIEPGGVGEHYFTYQWDEANQQLSIDELQLLFDGSWPDFVWCYKTANLSLSEEEKHYVLKGPWEGVFGDGIVCSPGTITLRRVKDISPEPPEETVHYTDTEERNVSVAQHLTATGTELSLSIWDNAREDGDRVSVFLNDIKVLDDLKTKKEHQKYTVTLQPGDNYLIFHAENLGDEPPNTAAVVLRAPGLARRIILRSDLQSSGAILIEVVEE